MHGAICGRLRAWPFIVINDGERENVAPMIGMFIFTVEHEPLRKQLCSNMAICGQPYFRVFFYDAFLQCIIVMLDILVTRD